MFLAFLNADKRNRATLVLDRGPEPQEKAEASEKEIVELKLICLKWVLMNRGKGGIKHFKRATTKQGTPPPPPPSLLWTLECLCVRLRKRQSCGFGEGTLQACCDFSFQRRLQEHHLQL